MPLSQINSASIEDGAVAPVDLSSVAQYTGFKNRIINGAMVIDQRNNGASVTPGAAAFTYTLDRWAAYGTITSKFSVQQNAGSVTPPVGYSKYLGVTSLSAYTVGASEFYSIYQFIEGFNTADLAWGTASAHTVTLSFWVRSSLTGTFGGTVQNYSGDANYPFSYTISAANTWEQKSVVITGPSIGSWATNNAASVSIGFCLGAGATVSGTAGSWSSTVFRSATGATSVVGTNGATFYITGVQFEKGVTATSFDYRPYGTELQLCQRYYEILYADVGTNGVVSSYFNGSTHYTFWQFQQNKRVSATVALGSGSSWTNGTPIIYGGISKASIGGITTFFYNTNTSGTAALTASAEL